MGEQVLWLAPGGLPATGIVLPGIYSNQAPAPSTDQVTEQGARAVDYIIDAALTLYYGPASQVVLQTANTRLDTYLAAPPHKLGLDVTQAGIIAALYVPSLQSVTLTAPATDIALADDQTARLTQRDVTLAGQGQWFLFP